MNNNVYSIISLAQKAGYLASGEFAGIRDIKMGKSKLVIIAEDSSDNTKQQFVNLCKYRNIPYIVFGIKELLGKYTGKNERAVLSVRKQQFAQLIIQKFNGGDSYV